MLFAAERHFNAARRVTDGPGALRQAPLWKGPRCATIGGRRFRARTNGAGTNDVESSDLFAKRAKRAPIAQTLMAARLTHTDGRGQVRMVDVGAKPETARQATASAAVRMSRATLELVRGTEAGGPGAPKGDVLATARLAAIAALKRTAEWIPLCHPVRVVGTDVVLEPDPDLPGVRARVTVRAFDRTGVEMEAMVGASAAALTIYDMVKGVERGVEILAVRLEEKSGGRTGTWRRGDQIQGKTLKGVPDPAATTSLGKAELRSRGDVTLARVRASKHPRRRKS